MNCIANRELYEKCHQEKCQEIFFHCVWSSPLFLLEHPCHVMPFPCDENDDGMEFFSVFLNI